MVRPASPSARRAGAGAKKIFDQNPDIEIVGTANIEYNEAPALTEMASLLAAHPDVNGIWHQAGAHASAALKTLQQMGLPLIPMTGENFNAYLKQWCDLLDQGFHLVRHRAGQLHGRDLARSGDPGQGRRGDALLRERPVADNHRRERLRMGSDELPDDWYAIPEVPGPEEVDKIIADALAAEQSGMATPRATPAA